MFIEIEANVCHKANTFVGFFSFFSGESVTSLFLPLNISTQILHHPDDSD